MNIQKAYLKVKKLPNRNVLLNCIDLGNHWGFCFFHKQVPQNETVLGACFDLVHKVTGKISQLPVIPNNFEVLSRGVNLDINQFK